MADLDEHTSTNPLLAGADAERAHSDEAADAVPVQGHWVWILTLTACISGLLFGYDTASISAALLHLGPSLSTPDRPVTTWDKSVITSATSFGALVGGLFAGVLADRIGRRGVIWVADGVFFVGALWQAGAGSVASMVWGRVVVGLGVGVGSLVVPLYIAELAPASHRGRLVVISTLAVTLGQLAAYALGIVLSPPHLSQDHSWRWMLGLGAVPAIVQVGLMVLMPETPRWLLMHGRRRAAAAAIAKVYGTQNTNDINAVLAGIERGVGPRKTDLRRNVRELLTVPGNRRALVIACALQFLQQACGFNSLMYFSATIFDSVGFSNPTATAMVVAFTNALFTGLAFRLIDRLGRRRMLLLSIAGMAAGLLFCALGFAGLPSAPGTSPSSSSPAAAAPPSFSAIVIIAAIIFFVATYAVGMAPVPWLCQSEFFRMEVRGLGTGAATATNWLSNLVVAATFLPIVDAAGGATAFAGYALVCAAGWVVVWNIYPETGGMQMEEIEDVLRDGWGVRK